MMDACYNKFLKICYILTSYWSMTLLQVSYFTLYYCGGKGVYLVYTSLSKSIIEESQGKNSRLLSMACSVWFLPQPRTICQGVTSPSVGWVFPYQPSIKTYTITLSMANQMEETLRVLLPDNLSLCQIDTKLIKTRWKRLCIQKHKGTAHTSH